MPVRVDPYMHSINVLWCGGGYFRCIVAKGEQQKSLGNMGTVHVFCNIVQYKTAQTLEPF